MKYWWCLYLAPLVKPTNRVEIKPHPNIGAVQYFVLDLQPISCAKNIRCLTLRKLDLIAVLRKTTIRCSTDETIFNQSSVKKNYSVVVPNETRFNRSPT